MVRTWLYERHLLAVLGRIANAVGHPLTDAEWYVIRGGVEDTDSSAGRWFEHEFNARRFAKVALARNPGTALVQVRVTADEQTEPQLERWVVQVGQYRVEGER
jgi:hypothetical protein